jgi:hypothetical protein
MVCLPERALSADKAGWKSLFHGRRRSDLDMTNLLHDTPTRDIKQEWARLHKILTGRLVDFANLPDEFGWPLEPAML